MEFKSTQKIEGDTLILNFEGAIDEDATFPAVEPDKYAKMVLDLNGISAINSVGIREWMEWIKPIAAKLSIRLKNCPKAMVFQFNMVEGFLPQGSVVESFYVPFYCEKCDKEENALFVVGKDIVVEGGTPKVKFDPKSQLKCTNADCELEMDVTEAKYFQFLTR